MTTVLNVGLWLVLVLLGYRGFRSCFMLKHWRCSIFDIEFFWHHLLLPVLSFLEKPLWYMCPDISLLRWSIRVTAFALFVRISEARKVTSWVLLPAWPGYVITPANLGFLISGMGMKIPLRKMLYTTQQICVDGT